MSLYDGCRRCGHGQFDHDIVTGHCHAGISPHCDKYLPPVHRKKSNKLRKGKENRTLKLIAKKPLEVSDILTVLYLKKYDIPHRGMGAGTTWPVFDTRWIYAFLNRQINKGEVMRIKRPHKPYQYQKV